MLLGPLVLLFWAPEPRVVEEVCWVEVRSFARASLVLVEEWVPLVDEVGLS